MKRFLSLSLLFLCACNLPGPRNGSATPTPILIPTSSPAATIPAGPTAPPGSDANPLILALGPSAHPTQDMLNSGATLAAQLEARTGYKIVTVAPATESDLVAAFEAHNADIGVLSPFGFLLVHGQGLGSAALASVRGGQSLYGAQFLARRDAGFTSYFDSIRGQNTSEAVEALSQFNNKKPCWSDEFSPSGYVVPLGFLNQAGVQVRAPAFLEGQAPLVRGVYAEGICDFGASYIDARELPALEADYPDVMEKVVVIWRVPAIIPYEQVMVSSRMDPEMKRLFVRTFIDLMTAPDGLAVMRTVYGLESLQPADEGQYQEFSQYVQSAGLDLHGLLK